jgi:hypothetical protein
VTEKVRSRDRGRCRSQVFGADRIGNCLFVGTLTPAPMSASSRSAVVVSSEVVETAAAQIAKYDCSVQSQAHAGAAPVLKSERTPAAWRFMVRWSEDNAFHPPADIRPELGHEINKP